LLQTWTGLSDMLRISGKWTDDQIGLAMNLMAVRPELREGYYKDLAEATANELAQMVIEERGQLVGRLEKGLESLDWAARMMAASGMPMEEDPDTKRIRKQESR